MHPNLGLFCWRLEEGGERETMTERQKERDNGYWGIGAQNIYLTEIWCLTMFEQKTKVNRICTH
jgi:lipoprotein NlpI